MDWNAKAHELATATIAAVDELLSSLQGERLYAISLQTDDGGMSVGPSANTEEGYAASHAAAATSRTLSTAYEAYLRWNSAEWRYEILGDAHFEEINSALSDMEPGDTGEDFDSYFAKLIDAMIGALATLRAKRAEALEGVTLFVSITDSDEARAIEDRSATLLNPVPLAEAFLRRFG
ncbi:DUF4303 domain-containing protein [Novosphingobium terrae]|uniref:DUF4303 domain-containing protein n=1 Tax=Novosphingobium terrae TaxID=2726189 RepID=UPI00197FA149|nr:DUF4303 domain-containing protein [Novosphingobium terrae]